MEILIAVLIIAMTLIFFLMKKSSKGSELQTESEDTKKTKKNTDTLNQPKSKIKEVKIRRRKFNF